MTDANIERGEVAVDIEGVPHVLTPSYQAQVAIERLTGRTIEQLAQDAGAGGLPWVHTAIVVTECVKAHGQAVGDRTLAAYNAQTVGECLSEAPGGKLGVLKRLELLLYLAATGGYTAKGEPRALPTVDETSTGPADIAV